MVGSGMKDKTAVQQAKQTLHKHFKAVDTKIRKEEEEKKKETATKKNRFNNQPFFSDSIKKAPNGAGKPTLRTSSVV